VLTDHELVEKLHWHYTVEEQEPAMSEIMQRESFDLKLLLQPMGKMYWDNAALVLTRMSCERLLPVMDGLFEWIADLNWPGADTVFELLKTFRPTYLCFPSKRPPGRQSWRKHLPGGIIFACS
jgi:hypothetical protein